MNKCKIRTLILAVALTVSMSSVSLLATTNAFADEAGTSQRLWGNDRYETAVAVSKSGFTTSDTVILVRGDDFADALAVTPLAKMYNAPILLTGVNSLPSSVQAEITRLGAKKIVIAGGIGAVSQAVENSLKKLATVERISGSDRYATSVSIAEKLGAKTSIALVTGSGFADGESMAAVAAQMGMPVIFTTKNTLSATAKKYIADNKVTKTYVIGGNGVISDSVAAAVPGMERLSGANRYDTNLAILNKFSNQINFNGVYVATGADFADALTASALAAKNSQAVVLASKSLTAANVSFIKGQITPKTVVTLVGGEKIVPSAIATSLKLDKTDYATDGKTYSAADITGKNINLIGKGITVDGATIKGNLYVYGNDTKLSNTTVTGTIFLDPGLTGDVTLKNVTASRIVVQSGAASSINLDSVTAAVLVSQSANSHPSTRIHTTGTTAIGATEIQSDISLNCEAGSFGSVSVTAGGTSDRNLELAGTFAPIHLTTPCTFTGTATPTVFVDAPGVIISGNVGDLVINTSTAPQFAPGTVIKRIIGTEVSKGIILTIPAGVTVTQATSDFVLAGAGASGIVVIPPTKVGDTTTPPVVVGGNSGDTTTKYDVTIVSSDSPNTILFGKTNIADETLSSLFDSFRVDLTSNMTKESAKYILLKPKMDALITNLQYEMTDDSSLLKYITQKLKDFSPGNTSVLADLIDTYAADKSDLNAQALINYSNAHNDTFASLLASLTSKTNLDFTIPTLIGAGEEQITITASSTGIATYTKTAGQVVNLTDLQAALNINSDTNLSKLSSKNFNFKIISGVRTIIEVNATGGTLTLSSPKFGNYNIKVTAN